MSRRLAFISFAASALIACISERPITDNQTCPCGPGWTCDIATNLCFPGNANPDGGDPDVLGPLDVPPGFVLPTFNAAHVQAALAQCDLPHGPVAPATTFGDKRVLMIGSWIVCPPVAATIFAPASVFAPDGTWNRLLFDNDGGLAPAFGVQNQGTYGFPHPDAMATNGNPYVIVSAASGNYEPSAYSSSATTLEMSPARIYVAITYLDEVIEVWLVRLP